MSKTVTFLGWAFFGLFLVLGLLAWASLPSRLSIVLGADNPVPVESAETEQLQRVVLDLEERLEELEGSVDLMIGELGRRAEDAGRAGELAARDRDALNELRMEMGGLARQADTLTQLLGEVIAGREAAGAAAPAVPAGSAGFAAGAAEVVEDVPTPESTLPGEGPEQGEDDLAAATGAGGEGVRKPIGFSDLLARKRWKLWDEPTTFQIVGAASQVAFDGSSTVHDFSGSTREISGSLRFDFSDPTRDPQASIVVDATTLDTEDEDRDEEMHEEHLESATYPKLVFTLTGVKDAEHDPEGDALKATATGVFEIHGRKQTVELPVTLSKRPGRRLLLEGRCPLKMSSFGIEPPSALAGVIKTSDDILVRVRLEAEAVRP